MPPGPQPPPESSAFHLWSLVDPSGYCLGTRSWSICTSLSPVLVRVPQKQALEIRILVQMVSSGDEENTSRRVGERDREGKQPEEGIIKPLWLTGT